MNQRVMITAVNGRDAKLRKYCNLKRRRGGGGSINVNISKLKPIYGPDM